MKKSIALLSLALGLTVSAQASAAEANANSASNIVYYGTDSLVKKDGTFWIWGPQQPVPTQIPELTGAANTFGFHMVEKQDHSVWLWETKPLSKSVTVKPVSGISNVTKIEGYGPALALDRDGNVSASVKTAEGWDMTHFEPVKGIDHVSDVESYYEMNDKTGQARRIFLKTDGTVWTNTDSEPSLTPAKNLDNVVQVEKNIALKKDGTVWTWPKTFKGTGSLPNTVTATQIKSLKQIKSIWQDANSSLAIDSQSRLWFWGAILTGYSDGPVYTDLPDPVLLTGVKNVKEAYVVEDSIVAFTGDNKVYATSIKRNSMPSNASFKLLASDVASVKNDYRHIIMQKKDGTLWGWGVNKNAELGYGDYEFMHYTPVPVQKPISVSLNGENVPLASGVITRNSQNFVPLRSVFEKMGAEVSYDEKSKQATVSRKEDGKPAISISVNVKTGSITLNNAPITIENKPFTVDGTVYLPLRLISEKLGATVNWLPDQERISIQMN
ncbi:stalk domain-containing protein [Paenibacillus sp. VCA1]|uniref:stalk domain-containing protein n=1 Tax=Paenibacillus sp. VCA1 TaxID=3039148 RepID=UPI002870C11A|nr:stalk domain-containing protein [Paenibacillus sp. VCA1]MDR9855265.1 stalk domain-containing protein [Paenibacillus sp. VCA1]